MNFIDANKYDGLCDKCGHFMAAYTGHGYLFDDGRSEWAHNECPEEIPSQLAHLKAYVSNRQDACGVCGKFTIPGYAWTWRPWDGRANSIHTDCLPLVTDAILDGRQLQLVSPAPKLGTESMVKPRCGVCGYVVTKWQYFAWQQVEQGKPRWVRVHDKCFQDRLAELREEEAA